MSCKKMIALAALCALAALAGCNGSAIQAADAKPVPADAGTTVEALVPLKVIRWSGKFADGWKEYDKLANEQKYEKATELIEKMLESAKSSNNSEEWVRCLIKWTQLRTALHGYETAVRFLREQPWPEDLLGRMVLDLYYGYTLVNYAHSYSWEINKREKVDTKGVVDLKAWTTEQIFIEAQNAYQDVWTHREQLGEFPVKHLAEYLEQNNYPDGIRPTLRDAVSYLRVELLADTTAGAPSSPTTSSG